MAKQRPNILVVFTDQQRWDACGCYGNPMGLTPNLDAMAGRGVQFTHAFTCQPLCGPARASLQTGLYATATGAWRNGRPMRPEMQNLGQRFSAAGYDTGYIGKWHLGGSDRKPVPPEHRKGYQYWLAADAIENISHPTDGVIYDGAGKPLRMDKYRVDWLTDRAVEYMQARRERPFFLFLSYLEPHHQNDLFRFVGPKGYADRFGDCYVPPDLVGHDGDWRENLADYYGACARIDECLGRMLDTLRETGQLDNTVVVFLSDHACHFRTRNDEHKRTCHESSIRIPLVFQGPGLNLGRQVNHLVSLVDVAPTLLDAAGLEVPPGLHGRSLLDLAHGQAADRPEEVFLQISEQGVGRAIRTERWKYCVLAPGLEGWQESGSSVYRESHLYDLQADPYEQTNLVGQAEYRSVADDLCRRLIARMVEAGESPPAIEPA